MIQNNLGQIRQQITEIAIRCHRDPSDIKLIAVSKRFPVEAIEEALDAGQFQFGENFIQESADKKAILGDSVRLHFIGHLQSNKAKTAAATFDMIETVDRFKIASALNRHLDAMNRKMDILIQVNIGNDPNKSGILPDAAEHLLTQIKELKQIAPKGLMTITPITKTAGEARIFFKELRILGERLQTLGLLPADKIELSMGMSSDFHIAIEEGATLIRIGTAIFGQRPSKTTPSQ